MVALSIKAAKQLPPGARIAKQLSPDARVAK